MNKIQKQLKIKLIVCILVSAMFVAGIPMIPVGAANEIWPVMIIGIIFAGGGFYATPLLWTNYGACIALKRVVYAVEKERLFTVQDIAAQLSKPEKEIRRLLDDCFRKGYLEGYIRKGDAVFRNEAIGAEEKPHAAECKYCGAKFTYKGNADAAICPYCGAANKTENPRIL